MWYVRLRGYFKEGPNDLKSVSPCYAMKISIYLGICISYNGQDYDKLEDDLYRKLVKEALEKNGRARNLSRIINEQLKAIEKTAIEGDEEDLVARAFGSWRITETGTECVRRLRRESKKRFEKLNV